MINRHDKKALLRIASTICANISSGWFAFILVAPNFLPIGELKDIFVLIEDIIFGIMFLLVAFLIEKQI